MNSEENQIEKECLEFLTKCSVDDFVALYEHMTLTKLNEKSGNDDIEICYEIVESEADEQEIGTTISFDNMINGVEAIFGMTDDDVKILHERIVKIKNGS
jgi:hypothetical protein